MALEAYNSLMLRHINVVTTRSGDGITGDWQLDLKMHCETVGVGPFCGTWNVSIADQKGQLVKQSSSSGTFSGDSNGETTVPIPRITITADQVFSIYIY